MEEWRDIAGYEGTYQVSSFGRVRSLNRITKNRQKRSGIILKLHEPKNGYLQAHLSQAGEKKHRLVARLVATAFIVNPHNLPEVNHKDENKKNNYVDNLEWCTAKYNTNYGTCIERMVQHTDFKTRAAKIAIGVVAIDVKTGESFKFASMADAEKAGFGIQPSISKCCNGKLKKSQGYVWSMAASQ